MTEDKSFIEKWKDGIAMTTPLQQTRVSIWSNALIFLGALCGVVLSLFSFKSLWWLTLILIGTTISTGFQEVATIQRYLMLKNIEKNISTQDIIVTGEITQNE